MSWPESATSIGRQEQSDVTPTLHFQPKTGRSECTNDTTRRARTAKLLFPLPQRLHSRRVWEDYAYAHSP